MNIQILGVGHSGTSIVTQMLKIMGWNVGTVDESWEEVRVRKINIDFVKTNVFAQEAATKLITELEQPWVIKDPRFVQTQQHWNSVYESTQSYPTLLHVKRSFLDIDQSHRKRGEKVSTKKIKQLQEQSAHVFANYPGHKVETQLEHLAVAIKQFKVERVLKVASTNNR